jgi:chromate transporter
VSGPGSLGPLVRLFLRLGFAGFGGPLVHIAMMETEVVERRRWLSKQEFLDGLALCQMLPGPASTQLGVLICHARGGLVGALVGGAAFILPGFCVMLAFTLLYERWGALPALGPVFAGIAPAVVAVILFSAWRLGRSAVTRADLTLLCGAGFVLTVWLRFDTALTLILCGVAAAVLRRLANRAATARVWAMPALVTAAPEVYGRLAWLWIKMGALVYGGGYVIIPVVRGEAVRHFGWLSDRVFLDGLALGQMTPGPIVNFSVFVGYQAGGLLGSIVAALGVFAPAFAVVLVAVPLMSRVKHQSWMKDFLAGVNASVVGAIAAATIPLARSAVVSPFTAMVGLASAGILWRFKVDTVWLVLGAGAAGWLWSLAG